MEVIIGDNVSIDENTVVAIGNFDGIHLGHQSLINEMLKISSEKNLKSVVCTFNKHTANIIKTRELPKSIMNNEQRIKCFESMNVDYLYLIEFDENIMRLSPEDFIKKIILDKLNAKAVVVGFNFRFGFKAKGDVEYLKTLGEKLGIEVLIIPPVYDNGKVISSSLIRCLIEKGKMKRANKLLGKPFSIIGKVTNGESRGRIMGFPTANIKPSVSYVIPKSGVYKTSTVIDNKTYSSITNIGYKPTFKGTGITIETHIFHFDKYIYDKTIEIRFLDFIRPEKKFNSQDDLIKQIENDIKMIK
ncbi:bifunctional riboflavin kinase/FAD synthetase [Caldisalinibacter kiritimatiensis]|uniref:Riboflavin biosynthesis protein n=1 Tax=Caldisalinibacter kiritimatiensis TaxID=1304284 RepID=R1AVE4_9FIRM|nr:bifunctional riboflavin kinase/FAD synthetase [Caldisalinibacter kiritimatiensis]EOD00627.1 Riboflavin kinase / FMN adenylyltransferase [Caldisalinibacter kiritimatiensis]